MTYAPAQFEVAMSNGLGGNCICKQEMFDLTLTQGHMKHCPLHHVTYVPAKFEVATPMVKEEMHLQENTLSDLDPKVKGVKVRPNVAQYSRHHVTYAPAKFDIATSHG